MEDVHQLRSFLAVAENLSFTRAAEGLFLTQSAVSHQIADLERALGVELFIRHGRTIELTPAGRVLVDRARRIFADLKDAKAAVVAAARPDMGRLRIGASATACQYLIPESLREFRESFPAYSLSITPGDSPMVTDRLLDGSIDLGVM
ncbi:MAG TPA: LysR family transcriptional regulator, partial [Tepidisphaeraceae bacterium]|nr:LysR family transcriptional regulator [Tepidisphaeraceae bacterium]